MAKNVISIHIEDIAELHPNLDVDHLVHCLVALIGENGINSCSFTVEYRELPKVCDCVWYTNKDGVDRCKECNVVYGYGCVRSY